MARRLAGDGDAGQTFGGFGIVMTDIFVAATSALLMAVAVARPHPPVALPIQADLVALCPAATATADGPAGAFLLLPADAAARRGAPRATADDADGLAAAVAALRMPARPFYAIALAGTPTRPLDGRCLRRFQRDLVDRHNQSLVEPGATPRMIFAATPVGAALAIEE